MCESHYIAKYKRNTVLAIKFVIRTFCLTHYIAKLGFINLALLLSILFTIFLNQLNFWFCVKIHSSPEGDYQQYHESKHQRRSQAPWKEEHQWSWTISERERTRPCIREPNQKLTPQSPFEMEVAPSNGGRRPHRRNSSRRFPCGFCFWCTCTRPPQR